MLLYVSGLVTLDNFLVDIVLAGLGSAEGWL